jgi:hypothetical protein
MKNMLTRTALASSVLLLSVSAASAQTTVSGNLDLVYKAVSSDKAAARSYRYFGKESQINLGNKGKLNNGMDYAAGFSLEFDGSDANANGASLTTSLNVLEGAFSENVFIDFISGNTTITFGADHIQNPDKAVTNLVGIMDPDDAASGVTTASAGNAATAPAFNTTHNSAYQAYGVGVIQTIPSVGKLSLNYTPDRNTGRANSDTTGVNTTSNSQIMYDAGQSAYEIGFIGDFGVKGLEVQAFYNNSEKETAAQTSDLEGRMYAIKYNMGQVTVAAQRGETTSLANIDKESDSFAIAYAINPNLSVGLTHAKTKQSDDGDKEKITQVSVGYNLGPVLAGISYATIDNTALVAGDDGKTLALKLSTKF